MQPSDILQRESLVLAMTEILWKAGDKTKVVVVVPCHEIVIDPPLSFTFDGVTEKLTCFYFSSEQEVEAFFKRNIFFVSKHFNYYCIICIMCIMHNSLYSVHE